jgi:hypothetical protein
VGLHCAQKGRVSNGLPGKRLSTSTSPARQSPARTRPMTRGVCSASLRCAPRRCTSTPKLAHHPERHRYFAQGHRRSPALPFLRAQPRAARRAADRTHLPNGTRTSVRYDSSVTERPRIAQREPRSLQPEQMGQLTVSTPAVPRRVHAWILWEDGAEELVQANAISWTRRAVRIRFGAPPHQHDVWVWAGAVERA